VRQRRNGPIRLSSQMTSRLEFRIPFLPSSQGNMFGVIALFVVSQIRINERFPHGLLDPCLQPSDSELSSPELMELFTRRKRAKYILTIMCILFDLLLLLPVLLVGVQECRFYPIRKAEQFAPGRGPELHVSELGLYDNSRITSEIGRLYCADNPIYCCEPISFDS